MYICLCKGVSDRDINQAMHEGACSVEQIMACTGAGTRCGSCIPTLEDMVESRSEEHHPASTSHRHLNVVPSTSAA